MKTRTKAVIAGAALILTPLLVLAVDAVTSNMGLTVPTPGVTTGPVYAQEINADLYLLDAHNHSPGKGAPVPTSGLDIDADLTFASFNGTDFRSTRFTNQTMPLVMTSDIGEIYEVNGDLWWNDASGTPVQITLGAGLNASTLGGFTGLTGTSAVAQYNSVNASFSFFQTFNPTEYASVNTGPLTIWPTTPDAGFGVTLKDPGLDASYALTFPVGLPTTTRMLLVGDAGIESYGPAPGGSNGLLQLAPDGGYSVGPVPLAHNALLMMDADGGVGVGPPAPSGASLLLMDADGGVRNLQLPANPNFTSNLTLSSAGALGIGTNSNVSGEFNTVTLSTSQTTLTTIDIVTHGGSVLITAVSAMESIDAGIGAPGAYLATVAQADGGAAFVKIEYSFDQGASVWTTIMGGAYSVPVGAGASDQPLPSILIPGAALGGLTAGSHILIVSVQMAASGTATAVITGGSFILQEIQ